MASGVRVLGIEGTAWAASAALYDTGTDQITIETEAYTPDAGGLNPREAAEHMAEYLPQVAETILTQAGGDTNTDTEVDPDTDTDTNADTAAPVDVVAFSQGPGLGPSLRIAGTTARALAQRLDVPLVGVNHMLAHLEIGRHRSGFTAPVCLNASGANAHILAYRDGRYRVLGETMDTGVGNAIDKFTRHIGWSHPGGPKVEQAAINGEYVDLPYVVKGMDFSFSGLTSAAKEALDDGVAVDDVCRGLEETVFAMLTEVTERALSLTGADEVVLGGGVGQNNRLTGMLETMCERRGAEFFAPAPRLLRDNAGMIAVLGAQMYAAGETSPLSASAVDPGFRPDEVPVTWRSQTPTATAGVGDRATVHGAEATVTVGADGETVRKRRAGRSYRHPSLDARLRRDRLRLEARLLREAREAGVPTPLVRDIDLRESTLVLQHVGQADLAADPTTDRVGTTAAHLAALHAAGIVHGDPTPRNVRVGETVYLLDFGLGYHSDHPEDHAMDLHVLIQSLTGTAAGADRFGAAVQDGYRSAGDPAVLDRLADIEGRGRYQSQSETRPQSDRGQ